MATGPPVDSGTQQLRSAPRPKLHFVHRVHVERSTVREWDHRLGLGDFGPLLGHVAEVDAGM